VKRWALWIVLLLSLGANAGILLTLALGGNGTPPLRGPGDALARPRWTDGPPEEGRLLGHLADRLGLEGETRERFLELQRQFFHQAVQTRRRGRELQRELGRELTAEAPDRQRIAELVDELADLRRELDRTLVETVLDTRELLGPEEERRYTAFVDRLRERMGREGRNGPLRRRRP
jgi:Spy/CpxP family protein refolding chaperone